MLISPALFSVAKNYLTPLMVMKILYTVYKSQNGVKENWAEKKTGKGDE